MAAALTRGELDVALLLTEGALAGIAKGGRFSVVSLYTASPLVWGIHVPASSARRDVASIRGARYAISRFGSGSHLMAVVHAREQGWSEPPKFVEVHNLDGAVAAFADGGADVFFWEKLMTKPLVDSGRFRRVGDFAAPWPAFVACASHAALETRRAEIVAVLEAALAVAATVMADRDAAARIAARYGLERNDVVEWLKGTKWADRVGVAPQQLAPAVETLKSVGLVQPEFSAESAIAPA
jgi:ABC-type nitrate/sulfonate/bicarbonate transport system substrate-binding protein